MGFRVRSSSCLMVMNARDIPECILSLKALKIDKVWFRGFTEKQLEKEIDRFIRSTGYSHYIIVSDDVIVTQQALDNLLVNQSAGPVVTGWCNIFPGQPMVNLELESATPENSFYIRWRDRIPKWAVPLVKRLYLYRPVNWLLMKPINSHFPKIEKIWEQPPIFRTYFVGWALTSITRELWLKYGFKFPEMGTQRAGHGSDRAMSDDLENDGVVALCARDSFIYHLASVRNFIVGKVPPSVIFEREEKEEGEPDGHEKIRIRDGEQEGKGEEKNKGRFPFIRQLSIELADEIEESRNRDKIPSSRS